MTVEQRVLVKIPSEAAEPVRNLAARADAALARARKLPPGDRTEAVRFESLHAAIDQIAIAALANGEPHERLLDPPASDLIGPSVLTRERKVQGKLPESVSGWVAEGHVVVELCLPHFPGKTVLEGEPGTGPPDPALRWASSKKRAKDAVQDRFEYLLAKAVGDSTIEEGVHDAAIMPSGIANSVLTEGLREYAQQLSGSSRVDAPVVYRDGSKGARFPLRTLSMTDGVPTGWRTLRFALMSIRHVEMDGIVDGAWLRNMTISRTRVAGLTDEIVFESSARQLRRLASEAPTLIYMYQTGLETAIVGFYRAVVHQLITQPGSIAVVPCYYHAEGEFSEGTVWATS